MEGLILAAGAGSRMGDLTQQTPKCLLQVGDLPILVHQLHLFREFGIDRTVVVTGYRETMIRDVIKDFEGAEAVYNPFWPLTNVISSVWFGIEHLTDSFVFTHGDTIFSKNFLKQLLEENGDLVLPYDTHPCAEEEMKVCLIDGKLVEISKDIDPAICQGEFPGVLLARKKLLGKIRQMVSEELIEQNFQAFFEVIVQKMIAIDDMEINMVDITGEYWNEIDTPADLEDARNRFDHRYF